MNKPKAAEGAMELSAPISDTMGTIIVTRFIHSVKVSARVRGLGCQLGTVAGHAFKTGRDVTL